MTDAGNILNPITVNKIEKHNPPDLIILDIMLPGKDGITICSEISAFSKVPILVSRPERVFTRSDLFSKIQGYHYKGYGRIIDCHIKNLRKKVDDILPEKEIIESVYGIGYKISVP